MAQKYRRAGIYDISYVLDLIPKDLQRGDSSVVEIDFRKVKMGSSRYKVFAKSLVCVSCSLAGQYFALEQDENVDELATWHFNLYGLNGCTEVLFTKDHIIPRALGGSNTVENYQTMCAPCNVKKGTKLTDSSLLPITHTTLEKQIQLTHNLHERCLRQQQQLSILQLNARKYAVLKNREIDAARTLGMSHDEHWSGKVAKELLKLRKQVKNERHPEQTVQNAPTVM